MFSSGEIVGEQQVSAKDFPVARSGDTGSWLGRRHHGQGIGTRMRLMVLHLAFEGFDAAEMVSEAHADNPASNAVSRRLGYTANGTRATAREGRSVIENSYRMTREQWDARPDDLRTEISLESVPPVRRLFGIDGPKRSTHRGERMTQADTRTAGQAEAELSSEALRERMIAELIESGVLTAPAIKAAFRAVPREVFAPAGTPAELPYAINDVVETRFTDDGKTLSSLSAPVMHAGNLHQAQIQEGQRVLEIGSGGPNAAMLAHLVGPTGAVVSVDIDESVTARTRAGLERLGLAERVEVVTADAFEHLGRGVFDRIMVTVSPWSIPQTWVEQLASDGILVVPIHIAPGLQRIIGFRKQDGRLISESTVPGGFVPLQGAGLHSPASARRTGPSGKPVAFAFTHEIPESFEVSDHVLASDPVEAWSGVTYENGTIWLDLLTYLLVQPDACAIEAEDPADRGSDKSFYPALVDGASFAALHRRPATDTTVEVGAIGKGPDANRLTRRLAGTITRYGADHRGVEPLIQWWPTGTEPDSVSPSVTVLPRPNGTLTISWPRSTIGESCDRPRR